MTTDTSTVAIAVEIGVSVEQVEAIKAFAKVTDQSGGVAVAPLWSDAELAARRANGAARRADESEALIAAAMVRRGLAVQL